MKNLSWKSQIYIISIKKCIFVTLFLLYTFSFSFIVNDVGIGFYIDVFFLIILLIFLYIKSDLIQDNALQILLYEKKSAQYEIAENGLIIKYKDKQKVILYKKVEYFTDISPYKIEHSVLHYRNDSKGLVNDFSDYADSLNYKVYYLFINKTFFFTAILPIFIPLGEHERVAKQLSEHVLFTPQKATKDIKFCVWGCVFPLSILFIIFLVLISL